MANLTLQLNVYVCGSNIAEIWVELCLSKYGCKAKIWHFYDRL